LPLKKRLPVYFVYSTVALGADGNLLFHPDIYGRDERLIAAFRAKTVRVGSISPGCLRG